MNKDMKLRKFIATTIREFLNEQVNTNKEFIVYHSTNSKIDDFNFDKIELKPNLSVFKPFAYKV
jgi:hypothetical protein